MAMSETGMRWLIAGLAVVLLHVLMIWGLAVAGFAPVRIVEPEPVELWLAPSGGGWPRLSATSSAAPAPRPLPPSPSAVATRAAAPEVAVVSAATAAASSSEPSAQAVDAATQAAAAPAAAAGLRGEGRGRIGAGFGHRPRRVFWLRDLTVDEARAVYPPEGLARRLNGVVRLSCVLREDDRIGGCMILSEAPERMGFGPAAIAASRLRGVRGEGPDGRARLNERIVLEMRFDGMGGGRIDTPQD
jgi:hypothetical protein